jgi:preprotein translocase subunit SecG
MTTVLIVIHLIVVLALVAVVLLQRSEGGGLGLGGGSGGGVSGFLTGRGQANVLTRATAMLAAAFFVTSLTLSFIAANNRAPRSILDGAVPAAPGSAPAGQQPAGGVLDQLRQLQERSGGQPGAPQAPTSQ